MRNIARTVSMVVLVCLSMTFVIHFSFAEQSGFEPITNKSPKQIAPVTPRAPVTPVTPGVNIPPLPITIDRIYAELIWSSKNGHPVKLLLPT